MKTLLLVANVDWFVISHRIGIAIEAKQQGWNVYIAAKDTGKGNEIKALGLNFIDFSFSRSGMNPVKELYTIWRFYRLYKSLKPDIVHQVTLKPVTYGSIAAKLLKIKGVVNAISGLGYTFTGNRMGITQRLLGKLIKFGFNRDKVVVIFQNQDDHKVLIDLNVLSTKNKIIQIKGSGVDLVRFKETTFPSFECVKILLPCRMLWDKGIKELREASDLLKNEYNGKIQFILAGMIDEENKAGVPMSYMNDWADGNYVKWQGYIEDMAIIYENVHIVILPSYREGMPKSLLEGCAIGRPIITTDAPGCKECVEDGINGFKVPVYSSTELAIAIKTLIDNPSLIKKMGHFSRLKAVNEFDVNDVINKHLNIYKSLEY